MIKRINCILIILIFMFYLLFPIVSVANEELVTIKFEDKNLYNAISEQLEVKINSKDNNNLTITMTRENIEI